MVRLRGGDCALGGLEAPWATLARIDVEAASAREPADQANIRRLIDAEMGGCGRINTLVSGALRAWMLSAGRAALAELPPAERPLSPLQLALARFLASVEARSEARALAAEVEAACEAAWGAGHEQTLEARLVKLRATANTAPQKLAEVPAALAAAEASLGRAHPLSLRLAIERVKQLREVQQRLPPAERDFGAARALCESVRPLVADVLADDPDGALKLDENAALILFFSGAVAAADEAYARVLEQVRGRGG